MLILETVFTVIGVWLFLIGLFMLLSLLFENLYLKWTYSRLDKKFNVLVEYRDFKYIVEDFIKTYNMSLINFEIVFLDKEYMLIKIKNQYFEFESGNLSRLFCEDCLIDSQLTNIINRYFKEKCKDEERDI